MENIILFLKNLFDRLNSLDFTQIGKLLGTLNIELMIYHVNHEVEVTKEEIKHLEEKRIKVSRRETVCQLSLQEIDILISMYKVKLKNRIDVIMFLEAQLNSADKRLPALPILRHAEYFKPGEDVMLYIGSKYYGYGELLVKSKWVYGKYSHIHERSENLDHVFFAEPFFVYENAYGIYEEAQRNSFVIIKPWEYEIITLLLKDATDNEFLNIFFSSSRIDSRIATHSIEKPEIVRAAFMDNRIDKKTPEELNAESRSALLKAIDVAYTLKSNRRNPLYLDSYLYLRTSLKMAEASGIFSPDELADMLPAKRMASK